MQVPECTRTPIPHIIQDARNAADSAFGNNADRIDVTVPRDGS